MLLDELVIESRWLPTDRVGILFMGSDFGPPIPFGDGMLCIRAGTTGFQRFLPPQNSGSSGSMTWGPGLIAGTQSNPPLTQISAGQTWHFQNWFRDPTGPCGSTYNLSNALKIQFLP